MGWGRPVCLRTHGWRTQRDPGPPWLPRRGTAGRREHRKGKEGHRHPHCGQHEWRVHERDPLVPLRGTTGTEPTSHAGSPGRVAPVWRTASWEGVLTGIAATTGIKIPYRTLSQVVRQIPNGCVRFLNERLQNKNHHSHGPKA